MASYFLAIWRFARAQNGQHTMAGVGIIDVDRQKAAFIVMRIEQRQLLMAMHDIGGVVDIEGDRLGRATVTLAPQLYHGSHQSYQGAQVRRILPA